MNNKGNNILGFLFVIIAIGSWLSSENSMGWMFFVVGITYFLSNLKEKYWYIEGSFIILVGIILLAFHKDLWWVSLALCAFGIINLLGNKLPKNNE
ncbi:hypothetical protein H5S09_01005 [Limosilactobacillus sp. STM2_1]|uniref:Uncharacterized protein n=1 Tax=Limosilactobacillus rudii TaxID=2759755 RepID=A0A7W3UJ60_9LACO|nr:hypothetical protein [Limosilactobacillus rudii]MBB1078422.1 hypothetical protein [Limosilactobacillus rudii]MBB1096552.1 hypothetical protein [Limosilactobacillus rudii]MCD7134252.1 hypothetical protein [Limosilactobacillus rudii]